ncbi:hypothetical protein F511_46652 [Dorcoceras hygrometricum]|uniref:Uncharacterized protein n=1 Tax=Dorcoceras hygrometricum TaxID=472368 RepID=A0A2Z6ZT01_9LAMI|nr:hypothetical protein F511_46652 [Dorcoceras hygrometricum]
MRNVEQEADNSKRNSEESDVVLKIQADALCVDNQQSQDTSRQLQYIQTRASALYLISRGCIANDVV